MFKRLLGLGGERIETHIVDRPHLRGSKNGLVLFERAMVSKDKNAFVSLGEPFHKLTDDKFIKIIGQKNSMGKTICKIVSTALKVGAVAGVALAALQVYRRAKTGCFRFEFKNGVCKSICKVVECSCGSDSVGLGVTRCAPAQLTRSQRLHPCGTETTDCVHCDCGADPASVKYLSPSEVTDGVIYSCEKPSLVEVFGTLSSQVLTTLEAGIDNTLAIFSESMRWTLAIVPVIGIILLACVSYKILNTLGLLQNGATPGTEGMADVKEHTRRSHSRTKF